MDANRAGHVRVILRTYLDQISVPLVDITACQHWYAEYDEDRHGPLHIKRHGRHRRYFRVYT